METIKIPGLPVNASRIGLGTWAIGGWMWGGSEESEAISTIQAALDNGIIYPAPRCPWRIRSSLIISSATRSQRQPAFPRLDFVLPVSDTSDSFWMEQNNLSKPH